MLMAEQVRSRPPSEEIVSRIADHAGVDAIDLEVPLYEAVDPDALDALFRGGGTGIVQFTYDGSDVTVEFGSDVTVSIED